MKKVKLLSNKDFQTWYAEQVKIYGSWGVFSVGETQIPIKYPCIVLGYEDSTYNTLHYDFVYLCDFNECLLHVMNCNPSLPCVLMLRLFQNCLVGAVSISYALFLFQPHCIGCGVFIP